MHANFAVKGSGAIGGVPSSSSGNLSPAGAAGLVARACTTTALGSAHKLLRWILGCTILYKTTLYLPMPCFSTLYYAIHLRSHESAALSQGRGIAPVREACCATPSSRSMGASLSSQGVREERASTVMYLLWLVLLLLLFLMILLFLLVFTQKDPYYYDCLCYNCYSSCCCCSCF